MKTGVQTTKNNTKKVLAGIQRLPSLDVLVGIPSDHDESRKGYITSSNMRTQAAGPHQVLSDVTNAQLGYIHENGAPEANIPQRPFLLPGIRDEQTKIASYLKQGAQAHLDGDLPRVERALHAAGLTGVKGAQRRISNGPFAPLKASTLRARRRRGRTGTQPLIDTNQLRRSLSYVIRSKRK